MAKLNVVIDLGSKFLGLGLVDRDFILREPCVVVEDKLVQGSFVASGIQALQKEKDDDYSHKIVFPIQNGEVVNPQAFEYLIINTFQKMLPEHAFLPSINVYCGVACSTSNETKRIIDDIFNRIGVKRVDFVLSPIADAFSARKELGVSTGITVNMGNNLTQVCVVDGEDVLSGISMQWGAVNLLDKIIEYVRFKYNMAIGRKQANDILINCISLYPNNMAMYRLRGVNIQKNHEETFEVSARELYETVFAFFEKVVSAINGLIMTESDFAIDKIKASGVILSGGLCAIEGLEKFFFDVLKMPVNMVRNPENSTIEGLKLYAKTFGRK